MARVPVNDEILRAARKLLNEKKHRPDPKLHQIVSGEVKSVDLEWWREIHGVTRHQKSARVEKEFKEKVDALKAHTDPRRNPYEHERRLAQAALAKVQAAGPPKAGRLLDAPGVKESRSRPLPKSREELLAMRKGAPKRSPSSVNTTKLVSAAARAKPEPKPVNTTKPRTADRHREPNRDRHSPGYMRDYMRRRREQARR
jgi:hypothetical protein